MQYVHVLMGEDGLKHPPCRVGNVRRQKMVTTGMQYTHVQMGENGLIPLPGGVRNMHVLLPEDGNNRDAVHTYVF